LSVIHRPQLHRSSSGIWNRFRYSLDRAFEITSNILITLLNPIDILSINTNEFRDILFQCNLQNIIYNPTRVTCTSQTLLDPFIISDSIQVNMSDVLSVENELFLSL